MPTAHSSLSSLPLYTPPAPLPLYSTDPAHDERVLQQTPQAPLIPTGSYVRKCGREIIMLTRQEEDAELPTYGREAAITGVMTLEECKTVSEIVLQIRGKMEATIADGGCMSTRTLSLRYTVWSLASSGSGPCPETLRFFVVLPANFRDEEGMTYPLPPSYNISAPGFFVKSSYHLSLIVTRHNHRLQFLSSDNMMSLPFNYVPRSRPPQPLPASSAFLSDVKTMPGEWRQILVHMTPRVRTKIAVEPLDIHLFLPTVEVFGLEDTIRFHIQITGPVPSLQKIVLDSTLQRETIQCTIQREILINILGKKTQRSVIIGTADLRSCPPGVGNRGLVQEVALDWDGELRCQPGVPVGAFDAGLIKIQDFLVMEITPPATLGALFAPVRSVHPVTFVSDSWTDYAALHQYERSIRA
ncbi:hypothetical protein B0H10DRAFT_1837595 [Mycena sp. CBHHK59/15]|nr:hypothetical protein B0H10DRAFT_1837595 [Mycena sp. CBHHK59/15]